MKNIFYISDPHLGHTNIWEKFKNSDGTPLRNFSSNDEMNEHIINQFNSVVQSTDKSYWLGDIVINKKHLHLMDRFNGEKILIAGNHDMDDTKKYLQYFKRVCSYRVFVDEFVCSHIPLHPGCISTRFVTNVHGHLHGNDIMWTNPKTGIFEKDPRYYSVCVEKLDDYKPIAHEDLKIAIKKRQEEANYTPPVKGWGNGSGPG